MKQLIIFMLQFISFIAVSQKTNIDMAAEKFSAVKNKYQTIGNYSMDVTHIYYASPDNNKPQSQYAGKYAQSPPKFYSNLFGIKTIQNEKYRVSIDSNNKMVVISQADTTFGDIQNADYYKFLKSCTNVDYIQKGKHVVIYMTFPKVDLFPYKIIRVYVGPMDLIEKVQIIYNPDPVKSPTQRSEPYEVEITYSNFKFTEPNKDMFSISSFFTQTGNTYTLSNEYKKYKLINNIKNL
jgi:hypothetical protein